MNLLCRSKYTGINKIWKWASFAVISEKQLLGVFLNKNQVYSYV